MKTPATPSLPRRFARAGLASAVLLAMSGPVLAFTPPPAPGSTPAPTNEPPVLTDDSAIEITVAAGESFELDLPAAASRGTDAQGDAFVFALVGAGGDGSLDTSGGRASIGGSAGEQVLAFAAEPGFSGSVTLELRLVETGTTPPLESDGRVRVAVTFEPAAEPEPVVEEETPVVEPPVEEAPEEMPVEEPPVVEIPEEETPVVEMPGEEMSEEEEAPEEEAPEEEVPAEEEMPGTEAPEGQVPDEDVPAEEVPGEETPDEEEAPVEDVPGEPAPEEVPGVEVPEEPMPDADAPTVEAPEVPGTDGETPVTETPVTDDDTDGDGEFAPPASPGGEGETPEVDPDADPVTEGETPVDGDVPTDGEPVDADADSMDESPDEDEGSAEEMTTDTDTEAEAEADTVALEMPSALRLVLTDPRAIGIEWEPVAGAAGYEIARDGVTIATTDRTLFVDGDVVAGQAYEYTVIALGASGEGRSNAASLSAVAEAAERADDVRPLAPGEVFARRTADGSVALAWRPGGDDIAVTGYNVYRDGRYHDTVRARGYRDADAPSDPLTFYEVVAFDTVPNFSRLSPAVLVAPVGEPDRIVETLDGEGANASTDGRTHVVLEGEGAVILIAGARVIGLFADPLSPPSTTLDAADAEALELIVPGGSVEGADEDYHVRLAPAAVAALGSNVRLVVRADGSGGVALDIEPR